jgi:PAS domain S-box-containing protein
MTPGVLIIDDEKSVRDFLQKICLDGLYDTKACATTEEAKELLKTEKFSVLLVDILLPDQSGLEFIKEIQDEGDRTPVIAITGSRELEHAQEAVRLNVFEYFLKPFENKYLLQAIKNAQTQYILNEERAALELQKDAYRAKLEQEINEKIIELEKSERKYRQLIEQSILGVAIVFEDKIIYKNDKFAHIFGYSESPDFIDISFIDLALPQKKKAIRVLMDGCLSCERDSATIQFAAYKKNEDIIYVQAWISEFEHNEKPSLLVIVTEITKQHLASQREKKYALELLKENRMASIGHLAAGITHNLNTPISIIQGNAELLKVKEPDNTEVKMILKQTARMNDLIYTIVTKGKNELSPEPAKIDLNDLIKIEIEFLKANLYFKHYINCNMDLDESIPSVFGLYSDYSQSISAIIQNAIDAMYKVEKREIYFKTRYNGSFIELIIRDTGDGIKLTNLDKIFEPFFTTKPGPDEKIDDEKTPRGTGLGLSMAASIFKKCNITVSVSSKLEHGTEFKLEIPVTEEKKQI